MRKVRFLAMARCCYTVCVDLLRKAKKIQLDANLCLYDEKFKQNAESVYLPPLHCLEINFAASD